MKKASRLTYADLEQLPDDGNLYELIDGELYVTSAPSAAHQRAVRRLILTLDPCCPSELEVFCAPFEWHAVERDDRYQPDLLVARRADVTAKNLPRPPVLAVEVLSPSTRSRDLVLKRRTYAQAGLENYWIVDPDIPSVTVLELVGGSYVERAVAKGDEHLTIDRPFPVTVCPADLVA